MDTTLRRSAAPGMVEDLATLIHEGLTISSVSWLYGHERYEINAFTYGAAAFAAAARMLASEWHPVAKVAGELGMELHVDRPGCRIRVVDVSGKVCQRVLVGTDVVEEQVPDPAWEGEVPMVTVRREVPRYELRCPPSVLALGDRSDETAEVSS